MWGVIPLHAADVGFDTLASTTRYESDDVRNRDQRGTPTNDRNPTVGVTR